MKTTMDIRFYIDSDGQPDPAFQHASQLAALLENMLRHRYGFESVKAVEPIRRAPLRKFALVAKKGE